jgi:TRAP-type C4-dicarboxylate transport system permease small subunit
MKFLERLDHIVYAASLRIAKTCFLLLFVLMFANVVIRISSAGICLSWYTEVIEMAFAYMVMFTATVLCHDKEHFKVDLLLMKYGDRDRFHYLEFATSLVAMLFFLTLLAYSIKLCMGAVQIMPVLRIPKRVAYLCIPTNAAFLVAYSLRDSIQSLAIATGKKPNTYEKDSALQGA